MYPKPKTDGPEILHIGIISESNQLGIEKQITTKFFDSLWYGPKTRDFRGP